MQIEFLLGNLILPQSYYVVIMYLHMPVQDCMGKADKEHGKNRQKYVNLRKINLSLNIKMVVQSHYSGQSL